MNVHKREVLTLQGDYPEPVLEVEAHGFGLCIRVFVGGELKALILPDPVAVTVHAPGTGEEYYLRYEEDNAPLEKSPWSDDSPTEIPPWR